MCPSVSLVCISKQNRIRLFNQLKYILTMFRFLSLPPSVHTLPSLSVCCSSIAVSKLEPELRDSIKSQYGDAVQRVYFNKGL